MKEREKTLYMDIAFRISKMSRCTRKQVGCVIIKNNNIISFGWNGTPRGDDNNCEDCNGNTKLNVIHAEDNAFRKLIRSNESAEDAVMFLTCTPCTRCSERISDAGIKKIYYAERYESGSNGCGLEYLKKHGIETEHMEYDI